MNEVSIVIFMIIAGGLWAVMAYAVGFQEGQRQGYTRGRAVSRGSGSHTYYTPQSDIEVTN